MPISGPSGIVHDGIQADALHGHATTHGSTHLARHVAQPAWAVAFIGAGLRQQQGTAIARVQLGQQKTQWPVEAVAHRDRGAGAQKLVIREVVHADQVEVCGAAAELGYQASSKHVQRLELRLAMCRSVTGGFRHGRIGADVDQWFGLDEACLRFDGAHRVDGEDRGTGELTLQLSAAPERIHASVVATSPSPAGDFIDRAEHWGRAVALDPDQGGGSGTERCEAPREILRPDVFVMRHAVVAQVPGDLHADLARSLQHRPEGGPVVAARLHLDAVPAQRVAHRAHAEGAQQAVVRPGALVMAGCGEQAELPAVGSPVR